MNLREIARSLNLVPVSAEVLLDREVTGCYVCDIMSRAMRAGRRGDLWVTVQAHVNVVAIAALLDLAGVLIVEGSEIDGPTLAKANAEGVALLTSALPTYQVAGGLWSLGIGHDV